MKKISKKQLNSLINSIIKEQVDGPFGDVPPEEEYRDLVESTKAHMKRVVMNLQGILKALEDFSVDEQDFEVGAKSNKTSHEVALRMAVKLKSVVDAM